MSFSGIAVKLTASWAEQLRKTNLNCYRQWPPITGHQNDLAPYAFGRDVTGGGQLPVIRTILPGSKKLTITNRS
jgi:hypothetical protein